MKCRSRHHKDGQLSHIQKINFSKKIAIDKHEFFPTTILTVKGDSCTILLNKSNGRPLQLLGSSYKNELVTSLDAESKIYRFGSQRLLMVNTITEDFHTSQLLCSIDTLSSTLIFNDVYLPPLKQAIEIDVQTDWPYLLFEICSISVEKEFFAVERVAPHRILVEKKNKVERPKIIKSTKQALKEPAEFSVLKKLFFSDPGYLKAVE